MRIGLSTYTSALSNFISGLKSSSSRGNASVSPFKSQSNQDSTQATKTSISAKVNKSILEATIKNTPRTDRQIIMSEERYYRMLDRENRSDLSMRDPKALTNYLLVKEHLGNSDRKDFIHSEHGIRNIHLALEAEPDPQIQRVIDAYEQVKNGVSDEEQSQD